MSFKVDGNRDLVLNSRNNISMNRDLDACLQSCENAVMMILGEDIYNSNEGLPNFELIWNGSPNIPQYKASIISAIKKINNVIDAFNFNYVESNNELTYTITISTTFGIGEISNVI